MTQTPDIRDEDVQARAADDSVLLHVWTVDPEKATDHVRSLSTLLARIADEPGVVSSRVLESLDRTSIAALIEMRSAEDRDRLEQLPDVRDTLEHLHGVASLVIRLYRVREAA